MKKITLCSLVAATVLFTACGEETKKVVEDVNKTAVAEAVKKDTVNALEAAKIKASKIAEEAKIEASKIAAAATEKAAEAKAAVKEKTAELTEAATTAVTSAMPSSSTTAPDAYTKCVGCHGADGKTKALGKSAVIAGQDKAALITSMNEYKAGTKNVAGMGMLMKGQVASMSDADIEAVAEYLSKI